MIIPFVIISAIYTISLAVIDALVNRLIFRENHKLSYFSPKKQAIYKRPEWVWYCFLFLIILPILPLFVSYSIGGIKFVLIYVLVFALIDWDIIFGKMVFDNWFGDLPSISLPKIGWVHFKLWPTIIIRLFVAILCIILLLV